nr:MAG TPA: RNA polymerase I-like protein [Caudoviricetes sp.]
MNEKEVINVQKRTAPIDKTCPYCESLNIRIATFRDWSANRYWNTPISINGYYCVDCNRFFFEGFDNQEDKNVKSV